MYIKDIYLENYIGIQEGTGRSEIFIDFSPMKGHNLARCLLMGRNGAGKSVLLNAMTPFPSQGDERSITIIPGRPGRKIITFQRNEDVIRCDIRWNTKNKASCFMFINGSEEPTPLTAKGNLGEYLKAVEEELGVTPEFLKIGRVGSRVTGFLDMGPAPRKNYIGKFMPEVEEWSVMHKNVSKRVSAIKGQLQGLQVELDRIEPRDDLEATAARATADVSRYRTEISKYDTKIGNANGVLAELDPSRNAILQRAGIEPTERFNPIADKLVQSQSVFNRASSQLEKMLEERPRLVSFKDNTIAVAKASQLNNAIATANGELSVLRTTRLASRGRLDTAIKANEGITTSLNQAVNAAKQLDTLVANKLKVSQELSELIEQDTSTLTIPSDMSYEDVKMASDMIMNFKSEIADLRNGFPTPDLLDVAVRCSMEKDRIEEMAVSTASNLRELRTRLESSKNRVATIEAQAAFHRRFTGMHCSDPRCPYEKHLQQYATAAQELDAKHTEIASLTDRITNSDQELGDYKQAAQATKAVLAAHARIRKHKPVLEVAGLWGDIGPSTAFYNTIASTSAQLENILSVERLLNVVALRRDISEKRRVLEGLSERITSLELLQNTQDQLQESVAAAEEAVTTARIELDSIDADITAKEANIKVQDQALQLINQLIALQEQVKTAEAAVTLLTGLDNELENLRFRWESAKADFVEATTAKTDSERSIASADKALSDANVRLARRDEYETRLYEIQGKLAKAQAVADACHPAKGAPIEFLRDFLDVTKQSVNDLLDVAMKGEFRIGFSLTDSEFRIPVSKGSGRIIPDVTEASEGQLALAKTVLSLALVKQTMQTHSRYNIVSFDEIDGMLDRERNRERFVEIIDRLSAELHLEQLTMISHNDSFHVAPAAFVLFPGHGVPIDDPAFLENKIILADFS